MPSILITGSNRGLGLEWCRQYAAEEWRVFATCRHPELAEELCALASNHPNVSIHRLDVTHADEIRALANSLCDEPIDLLINNAGIYLEKYIDDHFSSLDYDDWLATFNVNTLGAMRVSEAFLNHIARSDWKLVVAITSHMGSIAEIDAPGSYAYRSSKAALNAAMHGVARELNRNGIGVLLLHPGWVNTRMGGPGAQISTIESVRGMRRMIEGYIPAMSGQFYRFDGSVIPW
ncbi:MAG: SDR family oxidoreductase [Gammaproteobacteria bacterium]|nr:SDR family oxidoreductase [Gammaproteobacteria bacterium]